MKNFSNRTAVITGAASGIGLELARAASARGMNLVLADLDPARLEEAARTLGAPADRLLLTKTDVSKEAEVSALADAAFARFGEVGLLCNNAGVGVSRVTWEHTLEDWRWVIDVDLWSVVYGMHFFLPRMMAQANGGHIVSTASAAGLLSTGGMSAYNVAKHGVVALSETLYRELKMAEARVGVSVLCPAWTPTNIHNSDAYRTPDFGKAAPAGELSARYQRRMAEAVTSGRLTAADMARHVFEAVAEDRFYVIPHRKLNQVIQLRLDDILNQRNPTPWE
jgi:NAD(P)-dependent dehydrogenase (short-subunit alcohol dehydrogenase family)